MGVKRNMAESLWPESFQQIPLHEAEFQLICQWLYQAAGIRLAPNKMYGPPRCCKHKIQ
jgi:hypothetical protein